MSIENGQETKKPKKLLKAGAILALAGAAFGLSGCASPEVQAAPNTPVATAEASPSATATESPAPTSTPEATTSPETSAKFEGVVNYERFGAEWDAADRHGRLTICAEFFAANPPKTDVVPSMSNTGIEIADYYGATLDVLSALNSDKSNPENNKVADKIAECITSVHEESADGRTELLTSLNLQADPQIEGVTLSRIDKGAVTRFSSAPFTGTDYKQNQWQGKIVEGYKKDALLGDLLVKQGFEWDDDLALPGYRLVFSVTPDGTTSGDKQPPVVMDQSRANIPW